MIYCDGVTSFGNVTRAVAHFNSGLNFGAFLFKLLRSREKFE